MSVTIHESVSDASDQFFNELRRKNYTTPTSYLELIKAYTEMLKIQRNIVPEKINRYKLGLQRLKDTNQNVDQLKSMLIKLRPEIDKREIETQQLVVDLEEKQEIAAKTEKVFQKEAQESQKQFDEVQEIKQSCERDLEVAMPIYRDALSALETLNKNDIIEMKSYAKPPEELRFLICSVCLLLGSKENWDEGKKLMNEPAKFIESLKSYDKENIPEKILNKLKKYTNHPDFLPEIIEKKSRAGKSILSWVKAIDNFSGVMKVIAPKKEKLAKEEAQLKVAKEELQAKQASLQQIRDKIAEL
jgi:dynein heavy chain